MELLISSHSAGKQRIVAYNHIIQIWIYWVTFSVFPLPTNQPKPVWWWESSLLTPTLGVGWNITHTHTHTITETDSLYTRIYHIKSTDNNIRFVMDFTCYLLYSYKNIPYKYGLEIAHSLNTHTQFCLSERLFTFPVW